MKKLFILSLMLLFLGTFQAVKAVPITVVYEFEVTEGYGYDLITGDYVEDITMSSTTKMVLSPANLGYELNLLSLNFHHMLFFDEFNRYIGYINGNNSTLENEWYLGYDATAITNYPLNAVSFTFVNYDYEVIRDQIALTNPTIDDLAYDTLSYRDIFGNSLFGVSTNNLIINGDFSLDTNSDGIADNWIPRYNEHASLVNGVQFSTQTLVAEYMYFFQYISYIENHIYYTSLVYEDNSTVSPLFYTGGAVRVYFQSGVNIESGIKSYIYTANLDNNSIYFRLSDYVEGQYFSLDNVMTFDLTSIFDPYDLGNTLPTLEEFETMLAFYELYVDAPDELTYNDIFEGNNLVVNGDFSDGLNSWSTSLGAEYTIIDGVLTIYGDDIVNRKYIFQDLTTVNIGDIIYHSFDYETYIINPVVSFRYYLTGNVNAIYGINELDSISILYTSYESLNRLFTPDFRGDIIDSNEYIKVSNIKAFNFTTIFYSGLEPEIATFETYYSVWVDPLAEDYQGYYTAGNLLALGISWQYEPVTPIDLDVDNGLDNFLTNINMNSVEGKAGIGIVFMIVLAITIGLTTKSRPIVIISLVTTFLGFTVIGWFPVWIVIILTILLVILGFLKMKD